MKYIILLGDGMSDYPMAELGGKTPLQVARTPNMDYLAAHGTVGLARTVPEGLPPGSDVANLSVFGYNPVECYTGRAPLEAASIGVSLSKDDVAMRCNLVTLETGADGLYMKDFSAGHIKTEQATRIIQQLGSELGSEEFRFYPGVSYRHLLVWKAGNERIKTTPPHDITGKTISPFLPSGNGEEKIIKLMKDSQKLLAGNSINPAATSIWLWGQGKTPSMRTYQQKYGLSGSVISAVDLMKGIGIYAGLDIINVPGATGWIDTNYRGKAEYAIKSLTVKDFVYVHVEAPDEAAHNGMLKEKIKAIEEFDELVVGGILKNAPKLGDFKMLVLPDHPTPVSLKTHTSDPVPFVLYDSGHSKESGIKSFDENSAKETGVYVKDAFKLMEMMTNKG